MEKIGQSLGLRKNIRVKDQGRSTVISWRKLPRNPSSLIHSRLGAQAALGPISAGLGDSSSQLLH